MKMSQKKGNKTVIIIIVAIVAVLLLCSCCCASVFALGFFGSLPGEWQEKYNDQDWTIKDDSSTDSTSSEQDDLDYPSGDVLDWWWDATEDERDAYTDANGYPYSLYSFDWDDSKFSDGSWYSTESCVFPNGDIDTWWDTVNQDMRDCYMLLYSLPSFLYEGDWEDSGWYEEDNCDFPNGDVENWWDDATDDMKNCYVWTYGAPYVLYSDDFYDDDWDDSVSYDLSCIYELDCDLPNGDVEYWWSDATEEQKACYISENGYPSFWQGGICDIPNGDVESWWCSTDEDTRLCYIDYYGLPWFME